MGTNAVLLFASSSSPQGALAVSLSSMAGRYRRRSARKTYYSRESNTRKKCSSSSSSRFSSFRSRKGICASAVSQNPPVVSLCLASSYAAMGYSSRGGLVGSGAIESFSEVDSEERGWRCQLDLGPAEPAGKRILKAGLPLLKPKCAVCAVRVGLDV